MTDTPVISAFTEEHAARLSGLSIGQLRSWARAGFFAPHHAYEGSQSPYSRLYSFQDVVGLRTIAILMKKYGVSLQELKKVAAELVERGYGHWANLRLYVVKKRVHFRVPGTDDVEGVWDGQKAMLPIIEVINDVNERVEGLRRRNTTQIGQVERHKYIVSNATVVAGTRIPVAAIKRFAQAGYTVDQIVEEYPSLKKADVEAALAFQEGLAQSA